MLPNSSIDVSDEFFISFNGVAPQTGTHPKYVHEVPSLWCGVSIRICGDIPIRVATGTEESKERKEPHLANVIPITT